MEAWVNWFHCIIERTVSVTALELAKEIRSGFSVRAFAETNFSVVQNRGIFVNRNEDFHSLLNAQATWIPKPALKGAVNREGNIHSLAPESLISHL